ncbi:MULTISPECIES: hypothetical protein [unclassified Bartonella]|uniref:hypothetical protein n=1 Tax=unclassified Bartonella TaxID=2645622 RepID=UPI0035CE8A78
MVGGYLACGWGMTGAVFEGGCWGNRDLWGDNDLWGDKDVGAHRWGQGDLMQKSEIY